MPGEKLKAYLDERGVKYAAVARAVGISRTALMYKMQGKVRFNTPEIVVIQKYLRMTDKEVKQIFLS